MRRCWYSNSTVEGKTFSCTWLTAREIFGLPANLHLIRRVIAVFCSLNHRCDGQYMLVVALVPVTAKHGLL